MGKSNLHEWRAPVPGGQMVYDGKIFYVRSVELRRAHQKYFGQPPRIEMILRLVEAEK